MKASELGKFKALLKGYNVKASEIEKVDETQVNAFKVWVVKFPGGSKRLWIENVRNDNVFELWDSDFTHLMKIATWGKPRTKD